jgi:hypothetical protein
MNNIFDELEELFNQTDTLLATAIFESDDNNIIENYTKKRKLHEQAYFVLMFSRLEGRITERSCELVDDKFLSLPSWQGEALKNSVTTSNFKKRLATVFKKTEPDYKLICDYYEERNSIAHGGEFIKSLNIADVISNFKRLHG